MKRIMRLYEIKTGTQLALRLESTREVNPALELTTKFESYDGNELFSIFEPLWQGQYYTIWPNDIVHITFFCEGMRQVFQGRVVGRYGRNQVSFLQLAALTPITELQQRGDFRLPVEANANITYTDMDSGEPVTRIQSVRLRDLSGGGAGFYTDWNPGRISEMMMEIQMELGVERIGAEVRRAEEGETRAGYRYLVGAQFRYESNREKERVIRHIFQMQQKMIQERGRKSSRG